MTPEGKVKTKLRRMLSILAPVPYYFCPATGGYGRSGVPDIVGCWEGRYFAIECKAPGNKPTGLQLKEMEAIQQAGGVAFVFDGQEDWTQDKLVEALRGHYSR